jgi:hypothetical protein
MKKTIKRKDKRFSKEIKTNRGKYFLKRKNN